MGRIDGERVLHLAAQTLQSFFLGGGGAREHAEYALDDVTLLVPVLYPPAVRVFESQDGLRVRQPGRRATARVRPLRRPAADEPCRSRRLAAVIGAEGAVGGFSLYADWRAPGTAGAEGPRLLLALGPVVVTPDELDASAIEVRVRVDGDERLRGSRRRLRLGLRASSWRPTARRLDRAT